MKPGSELEVVADEVASIGIIDRVSLMRKTTRPRQFTTRLEIVSARIPVECFCGVSLSHNP